MIVLPHQPSTKSKLDSLDVDKRTKIVLTRLIDVFLEKGEPVGSRTLAGISGLNVSAATIRNIMADLEDMGLLYSPHASSGRLPTEGGLRLFVDALLNVGSIKPTEQVQIEEILDNPGDLRKLLDRACLKLSGLTRMAGLVLAPTSDSSILHAEFVRVSSTQALVVLVTDDGLVENRLLTIPKDIDDSILIEASNFIRARFCGQCLNDIRNSLVKEIEQSRHELSQLTQKLLNIGVGTVSKDDRQTDVFIVHGHAAMLEDAAVQADLDRMRRIFTTLDRRTNVKRLLDETETANGVQVFIGSENSLFSLTGCSAIVAPIRSSYAGDDQRLLGAIGVVGPSYMNYGRILPLVDFTARLLSHQLDNLDPP